MRKNLKTLICCLLALLFVSGTIIGVVADNGLLGEVEAESASFEDITDEELTGEEEDSTPAPTTEAPTEPTTQPSFKYGDVNGDGYITAADARLALRASAQLEVLTDVQKLAADVIVDGNIIAADARRILRCSARLITEDNLPVFLAEGQTYTGTH